MKTYKINYYDHKGVKKTRTVENYNDNLVKYDIDIMASQGCTDVHAEQISMDTNLDRVISSVEDAKKYLLDLCHNGEEYHPDDRGEDMIALRYQHNAEKLDALMEQCFEISIGEFDIYGFVLDNSNYYQNINLKK